MDVEPSHCGYCLVSIRNLNIIRTTELLTRNNKEQTSQSFKKHTYICLMYCVYIYVHGCFNGDWYTGWSYVCTYVCVYICTYVPYKTPLVIFYLVVICAVTSIQLHSALGIQHNLRMYVHMYIIKHAVIGDGSEAMANWHPDTYVHTIDVYTCSISYFRPCSHLHTCTHTH